MEDSPVFDTPLLALGLMEDNRVVGPEERRRLQRRTVVTR